MRRWRVLIGALLAVVTLGVAYWFYANFEWVPVERELRNQGEARSNSFLAAERFLSRMGFAASSARGLHPLPGADALVVWGARHAELDEVRRDELVSWAADGGHLVLGALGRSGWEADTFPSLGIGYEHERTPAPPVPALTGEGLSVAFDPDGRLHPELGTDVVLARDGDEVRALSRVHGRGRITILTDLGFARNRLIGERDHAAFLATLAELGGHERVVLVFADTPHGLGRWLVERAWPVLVSGACLLVLCVWWGSRRFGPLAPAPEAGRRRLSEHIDASGRFAWRTGHHAALYQDVRASVLRSLEFRHPGWPGLGDLAQRLAAASGLSAEVIEIALSRSGPRGAADFTEAIRVLETIRRSL